MFWCLVRGIIGEREPLPLIPAAREAEAGESRAPGQPGQHGRGACLEKVGGAFHCYLDSLLVTRNFQLVYLRRIKIRHNLEKGNNLARA